MKKKVIALIGIGILLLIGMHAYFQPLSLSNALTENSRLSMHLIGFGDPDLDTVEYKVNTAEQPGFLTFIEQYPYRRTLGTLFSNGTITETGNNMLSIYVLDDQEAVHHISVTPSGKIVVNGKNYYMQNAEQFIEQIIEMME